MAAGAGAAIGAVAVIGTAGFRLSLYMTMPMTTAVITAMRRITIVPQLAFSVLVSVFEFVLTLMQARAS